MSNFPSPLEDDWIGHPNVLSDHTNEDTKYLITHRDRIEVLGGWSDPEACYSYDEIALIRLSNHVTSEVCYYALNTAGCSCPSPTETWQIDFGPATLDELREWCSKGNQSSILSPLLTDEALGFAPSNKF